MHIDFTLLHSFIMNTHNFGLVCLFGLVPPTFLDFTLVHSFIMNTHNFHTHTKVCEALNFHSETRIWAQGARAGDPLFLSLEQPDRLEVDYAVNR